MNKFFIVAISVSLSGASSVAAVPCGDQIRTAALDQARSEGYDDCHMIGQPSLSETSESRIESGEVQLSCPLEHVSPTDMASRSLSFLFSARVGDCSTVAVADDSN